MHKFFLGSIGLVLLSSAAVAQSPAPPAGTKLNPKDQQTYVWIAPGSFTMGCSPTDTRCAADEKPAHTVQITKGFWMGQTPVTVAAWKHYRDSAKKPALPPTDEFGRKVNEAAGDDNQPVVESTWDDAHDYCTWAGLRLPTESEWEFAARAGTSGPVYGWLGDIAWYADNSGKKPIDGADLYRSDPSHYQHKLLNNGNGPRPVKQKLPNAWGLYDMLGNVWQWTNDYYAPDAYINPGVSTERSQRVLRGGAWNSIQNNIRVSYRLTNPPGDRVGTFGFRCTGDLP